MLFSATRTKGLAGVLVAQTGQFVAAVNAFAITCDRRGLNRYQGHSVCPFRRDSTGAARFSQGLGAEFHCVGALPKPFSVETSGTACQCFRAIRSRARPASLETPQRPLGQTAYPRNAGFLPVHGRPAKPSGKVCRRSWRRARRQPRKCATPEESVPLSGREDSPYHRNIPGGIARSPPPPGETGFE